MARFISKTVPTLSSFERGLGLGLKDVRELSAFMSDVLGIPYDHMPVSFFKRRLTNVFAKNNIRNVEHFKELLTSGDIKENIYHDFSVSITEMFRDPGFWRYLRSLLQNLSPGKTFTVWFPDASSGEEVFSFLILIAELNMLDRIKVICQHPSSRITEDIRKGILRNKNAEVNANNYIRIEGNGNFKDYYSLQDNIFVLNTYLLQNVETVTGHFLNTAINEPAGLIMFRNKMIYYDKEVSEKGIKTLTGKLSPGGLIAIGGKEKMPESTMSSFKCINEKERVFKKHGFDISWNNGN
ncbi:MAG: hypothetical protein GXO47_06335 [Chlorobi bacterium]|nr:hypothetical protein [Chlorobiota bacterium]